MPRIRCFRSAVSEIDKIFQNEHLEEINYQKEKILPVVLEKKMKENSNHCEQTNLQSVRILRQMVFVDIV